MLWKQIINNKISFIGLNKYHQLTAKWENEPFHVLALISKLINSVPLVSSAFPHVIKTDFPYLPLWHISMLLHRISGLKMNETDGSKSCKEFGGQKYITFWTLPSNHRMDLARLNSKLSFFNCSVCNIPTATFGMIYAFRMQMRNMRNTTVKEGNECQWQSRFFKLNFLTYTYDIRLIALEYSPNNIWTVWMWIWRLMWWSVCEFCANSFFPDLNQIICTAFNKYHHIKLWSILSKTTIFQKSTCSNKYVIINVDCFATSFT